MTFGVIWLKWELELHRIVSVVKVMADMVLQVGLVSHQTLHQFLVLLVFPLILAEIPTIAMADATVNQLLKVNALLVLMVQLVMLVQMDLMVFLV